MAIKDDDDPNLYTDSGATTHMINNSGKLSKIIPYKGNETIVVGNGERLNISHLGEGKITTENGTLNLKKCSCCS